MMEQAFRQNARERKVSRERSRFLNTIFTVWFLFTCIMCCALILFLHVKLSQDLTRRLDREMSNYKLRINQQIRYTVRILVDLELDKLRRELKKTSSEDDMDNQKPVLRPRVHPNDLDSAATAQQPDLTIEYKSYDRMIESDEGEETYDDGDDMSADDIDEAHAKLNETLAESEKSPLSVFIIPDNLFRRNSSDEVDSTTTETGGFPRVKRSVPPTSSSGAPEDKVVASLSGTTEEELKYTETTARLASQTLDQWRPPIQNVRTQRTKTKRNGNHVINAADGNFLNVAPSTHSKSTNLKNQEQRISLVSDLEATESLSETTYMKRSEEVVVAAHFGADSTVFKSQKRYYEKNDIVRHPTGEYTDWKYNDWHQDFQMHKHVNLTSGRIFIQNAGLYFVYAQIHFTEWTDVNGYTISKNNNTVFQCITSSYGDNRREALSNTCYTGGIVYCSGGDELKIKGLQQSRRVVMEATKSFFGMFKIAESQLIR